MKILERNEFVYHFVNEIYINTSTKKIFSIEAIEKRSLEWLAGCISKDNAGQWEFYFIGSPPESIKKEIAGELEKRKSNIEDLIRNCEEAARRCLEISPVECICHSAPTGKPFLTLASGGFKGEGEETKVFPTEKIAIEAFRAQFFRYLNKKRLCKILFWRSLTLYWRAKPCVRHETPGSTHWCAEEGYWVRARLLISSKPIDRDFMKENPTYFVVPEG